MADESMSDVSGLRRQLARLERRARLVSLVNGLSIAALLVAGLIALALLTDAVWNVPLTVRMGLLIASAAVAVIGVGWAAGRALLRRSDPAAVAALVESAYPQLHERLSSAMEWEHDLGSSGSPLMKAIVIEQAGRSLTTVNLSVPLPLARASRRGAAGIAVLAALLAPCLFSGGYRLMLHRFAMPWKNLERSANLYLVVTPGDASVARGSDVEITAAPKWRIAQIDVDRAELLWRDESGRQFERQMTWHADRGLFVATVADVLEPFRFQIDAGQARSREFRIEVVDRPQLTAVTAIIEPPGYSGRAVEQLTGAVGELEMLRGSRLVLQLQFSLPVESVALLWTPDATADGPAAGAAEFAATVAGDGALAEISLTPEQSGRFAFRPQDLLGPFDVQEPQRRIRLIDDAPPTVLFAHRARASRAAPGDVLRLPVLAGDDIGLAALELHYQVVDRQESAGQIDAGVPLLGVRSIEHEFVLDLAPLALAEGAVVAIRARAADERADPGPNESWTEQRLISITSQADAYESEPLAQRQQQLFQSLERLRVAVDKNLGSAETLRAAAADRQASGSAFDRDAELADLADSNAATVADAERLAVQMELHPLLAPLGARTRRVGREQLTSAAGQATTARSSAPADTTPALAAAVEQLTQARVELAAVQRDLEHLAELEQDLLELQRLADDTDRLAKDVAALKQSDAATGQTAPADPGVEERLRGLAADRLRADHAELSERLDDLVQRRPELLDAAAEHHLDHLAALRDRALQMAQRERQLAVAMEAETESADSTVEPTDGAQLTELADRQTRLVEQAVEQALDAAESAIANPQDLAEVAAQAAAAAEAVAAGDLNAAASSARQAAQRASATADASAVADESLQKLADEQAQVAEQLEAAAGSAATRTAARQASQQRLAAGAQQLEQEFQQVAGQLTEDPVLRADDGARAANSGAATRQAHDHMTNAATAQSGNDLPAAAAAAHEAVKQLETAAEQALAATSAAPDSPVPTEVGHQVAQASQQLRRAGEQLANSPQRGTEADSREGAEQAAREAADGESPEPAAGEQSASESGEGQPQGESGDDSSDAQSSGDDLAQAAASLQAAAQRLKPRDAGRRPEPGDQAAGQQPGTSPESDAAADGSGSTETAQLTALAEKIKARAARNWGELPGELRSELQQRMQSRPDADYAPLIRMYFDEISRRPSPEAATTE